MATAPYTVMRTAFAMSPNPHGPKPKSTIARRYCPSLALNLSMRTPRNASLGLVCAFLRAEPVNPISSDLQWALNRKATGTSAVGTPTSTRGAQLTSERSLHERRDACHGLLGVMASYRTSTPKGLKLGSLFRTDFGSEGAASPESTPRRRVDR